MEEQNKKIDINNMITLCHIFDEFKEFENRILTFISPEYNRYYYVFQLCDISKGKFKLGAIKAKRFYEENKSVIDTINKYSNLLNFINLSYGYYGKSIGNLRYFYEYLSNHKVEIPKIIELLEKIKELGFEKIEFNEELDFTKEIFHVYQSLNDNFYLTYVANPQVIPNYTGHINFKTENSNYKMKLELLGYSEKEISKYGREIVLNSLLFDSNTLPEKLDIEHIFGHLLEMKKTQEEKNSIIRNSVDLSVSVSDFELGFNYISSTIERLEGVENKQQLLDVLSSIKSDIEKLRKLSEEYNNSISENDELLTPEFLEKEKKLYLERREWSRLDIH